MLRRDEVEDNVEDGSDGKRRNVKADGIGRKFLIRELMSRSVRQEAPGLI